MSLAPSGMPGSDWSWYFDILVWEEPQQEHRGKETVVDDGLIWVRLSSLEMIAYTSFQW